MTATLTDEQRNALARAAKYFHNADLNDKLIITEPGAHTAQFTVTKISAPFDYTIDVILDLFWHRIGDWNVRFGYSEEFDVIAVSDVMHTDEFYARYNGKFAADSDL